MRKRKQRQTVQLPATIKRKLDRIVAVRRQARHVVIDEALNAIDRPTPPASSAGDVHAPASIVERA